LKIGILSFAHIHAEAYIQNLRAVPGVEMIGLADENQARGEKYSREFGAHLFRSYEDLLATHPDGVVICSENSKHRPLVEMAASAGVNVLCEKPLATRLEDAKAIVDACRNAGVLLMTAFPMRFSTPLIEVKARLDAGDLGQVFCFNSTNQGELPTKGRTWFADKQLAGGGALMDHTVHLVDIMRWYLGSEVSEVYARTNHIFHADEVEVETGALEMITFQNGVFASIDCSWSRPPYWPSWGGLTFEMVTDRGAVLVDAFSQNLTVFNHELQRPSWLYWGSDANQSMVNEFVSAIQENRQPLVTGMDGYRAVEVALAAYQSDQSGQPVQIEG
jgi:predicted dehydrogenase